MVPTWPRLVADLHPFEGSGLSVRVSCPLSTVVVCMRFWSYCSRLIPSISPLSPVHPKIARCGNGPGVLLDARSLVHGAAGNRRLPTARLSILTGPLKLPPRLACESRHSALEGPCPPGLAAPNFCWSVPSTLHAAPRALDVLGPGVPKILGKGKPSRLLPSSTSIPPFPPYLARRSSSSPVRFLCM